MVEFPLLKSKDISLQTELFQKGRAVANVRILLHYYIYTIFLRVNAQLFLILQQSGRMTAYICLFGKVGKILIIEFVFICIESLNLNL